MTGNLFLTFADGRGQVNLLTAAGDDLYTPLHDAVNVGAVEVVRLLLKHGGKILYTLKLHL